MSRPTIALACIMKNEAHNIGPMLQSVKGCFDEIVLVDTGSTDGTIDFVHKVNEGIENKDPNWEGYPKIKLEHFEWVNDFAKARNYSFSKCTSEYITWMDLDDSLSDASAFIKWRDTVLHSAHYWVALYNYAFNPDGGVECKFIRERVIKNCYGFKWHYFVHEGILQDDNKKFWPQRVSSWWINHRRTDEDRKQDHMRNIKLFESHDIETQHPRMKFYYGKELMENGMPDKASKPLLEAIKSEKLDSHDLVLTFQYAGQSAFQCKAYAEAINVIMNGLKIHTSRAELWCLLGDTYIATGRLQDAEMAYKSALNCRPSDMGGILVIYNHAYGEYPRVQLAHLALQSLNFKEAEEHIQKLEGIRPDKAMELKAQYDKIKDLNEVRSGLPKTGDVLITCPPGGVVTDWDENTLKEKGHGGSETAAIEVAKWIKKKTGRPVKIFNQRARRDVMDSGVEYLPASSLAGYLHNIEPHAHIAWRHAVPITKAKTYVWCHDLNCPGAQHSEGYEKIIALSGFHKNYLMETNGVKEDKVVLGFNGINPDDFLETVKKDPLKVVFSSSPDRGLSQTIDIVKKAREISGLDIKLHCFYGFDNMRKMGHSAWADQIEGKIKENDFVVHHGLVTKSVLMKHFKEAGVWLYPADFIESYCITAIEALCAGVWPIVRDMGALKYTMKEAIEKDMCDFTSVEVTDEASIGIWANLLHKAILDKKWERVKVDPKTYSWEMVADLFSKEMSL